MGKGGGSGSQGIDPAVQQGMLANQTALVNIAQQQSANAQTLFGVTEPGLQTAEQFYQSLATGDPAAIMRATAPAAEFSAQAAAGAKKNIMDTAPSGGERNLALEAVDAGRASDITKTGTAASLGGPNALAALAGQGVGESISAAGTAVSGLSSANQGLASLGGLQINEQQIQAEEKGNVLGALGGALGTGAEVAMAFA